MEHLLKLVHLLSVVQMKVHMKIDSAQLLRTLAKLSTDHENLSKLAHFLSVVHIEALQNEAAAAERILFP